MRSIGTLGRALGTAAIVAAMTGAAAPASATTDNLAEATAAAHAAEEDPDRKILISKERRLLWLVINGDTVMRAPVAIGKESVLRWADRVYRFETPTGQRRILAKHNDPSWIPPNWHYYEKAAYRDLEPVHLADGDTVVLSDSTRIEVRDKQVGRVNRWGNWWPFTPGSEIIFDGKIFIPPLDSPQRRIPNALGPIKLSLGEGYLIHGTHRFNEESIGDAASHGCIRMRNDDVVRLSELVDVGTPVHIF